MAKLFEETKRIVMEHTCKGCPHAMQVLSVPRGHAVQQTIECLHPAIMAYFKAGAAGSPTVGIWHTNGYPSEMRPLPSWCPLPDAAPEDADTAVAPPAESVNPRFPHTHFDDDIPAAAERLRPLVIVDELPSPTDVCSICKRSFHSEPCGDVHGRTFWHITQDRLTRCGGAYLEFAAQGLNADDAKGLIEDLLVLRA